MTQENLNNIILTIRCKAAALANSRVDKLKIGKWCEEQECALLLADWTSDVLCKYDPDSENNCFKESDICRIFEKIMKVLNFKCDCC